MIKPKDPSRRKFVTHIGLASAGFAIVPRHVLGKGFEAPSDTLNVAFCGVGGQGRSNMINLASQNIVALCDVDWEYANKGFESLEKDIKSQQKRLDENMLEFRLPASARGEEPPLQKRPLTELERARTTAQVEAMTRLKNEHLPRAKRYTDYREMLDRQKDIDAIVVATPDHLHANIALAAMDLGKHVYVQTPLDKLRWNGPGVTARIANALYGNGYSVPKKLAWNLFLGPAPHVDYHPIYHPFNWRGWVDWGVGAIGDMGAHLIDHSMWALDLGFPTSIETVSTPFNGVCFPHATMTFYEFPPRGEKPAVKLTWYDGGFLPPKPAEMGDDEFNKGGGALLVGSKGKLLHDTYGVKPRLLPKSLHESVGKPPQKLTRIPNEGHEMNWVEAAKGKTQASCPFEYAARLTEVMLLGVVSLRAGKKLEYDGANMRVTNDEIANQFLQRTTRGTSTSAI